MTTCKQSDILHRSLFSIFDNRLLFYTLFLYNLALGLWFNKLIHTEYLFTFIHAAAASVGQFSFCYFSSWHNLIKTTINVLFAKAQIWLNGLFIVYTISHKRIFGNVIEGCHQKTIIVYLQYVNRCVLGLQGRRIWWGHNARYIFLHQVMVWNGLLRMMLMAIIIIVILTQFLLLDPLLKMNFSVSFLFIRPGKFSATDVTAERFFPCVCPKNIFGNFKIIWSIKN